MNRPGSDYSFQVEWGSGRGLLLWLAMVMGSVGGGAFLVSTAVNLSTGDDLLGGSALGLAIATVGKGGFHLAFLGRPERFWRALRRPHSSWLSRGIIILGLFGMVGLAYLLLAALDLRAAEPVGWAAMVLAVALVCYDGFLIADTGIPFWNTSILPVLYGTAALAAGVGVTISFLPYVLDQPRATLDDIQDIDRYVLLALASLILSYLWIMYNSTNAARRSVLELLQGRLRAVFILTCVTAVLVPAAGAVYTLVGDMPDGALSAVAVTAAAGDFAIKYSVLKAGIWEPLIPRFTPPTQTEPASYSFPNRWSRLPPPGI